MSRSKRKPYRSVGSKFCAMSWWKRMANKAVRLISEEEEIPFGNYYRRYEDIWTSPRDGRQKYHPEDGEKLRRK